ncbi:MAG: trigger factor [Candidatus Altimarinota bacterium]
MPHQYTLSDLEHSRKKLLITEIDAETLKKAEKKVLQDLSSKMKVKGFRPGKVPESMVREQVDPQYFQVSIIEQAMPMAANEILSEAKVRVIGTPQVNYESLDPLKIDIEFDVLPEAKVGDYKKISVKKEKKTASDKEVQQAIDEVQKRMTDYKEVEREAKMNDRVEVDFEGFTLDGVPLENTASKNHPVVLGSNMLIPGFEEEVVGMKKDEEKEFEITFPKDYHAKHLAGEKVKFKIKLNRVEASHLPQLNEAFIEQVSGKKQSLEEWKKQLLEYIQKEHDRLFKQELEEAYFDELVKITKLEAPKTLVEDEKQAILREIKERILYQGLSYERYLQAMGKTEEQLLESFDKQAEERIKLRMGLQHIADQEGLEVTELDVEEKLNQLLAAYPEDQKQKIKQRYLPGSQEYTALAYQLKMQKTLEKILPKV